MNLKAYVTATRMPFVTASVLPVLLTGAWVWANGLNFNIWFLILAAVSIGLVHLCANTANDYFDWDESDKINKHAGPFSGGSRARLENILDRKAFLVLTLLCVVIGLGLIGIASFTGRPYIGLFALVGAGIGIGYSLPPLSLQKRGIGEIFLFLAFGPLLTLGAGYTITGSLRIPDLGVFLLLGISPGLLTTAILWINEFPDFEADKAAGKRNMVVRLGLDRSRLGYAGLLMLNFVAIVLLAIFNTLPLISLALLVLVPLAWGNIRSLKRHFDQPRELIPVQGRTIGLQAICTILITAAIIADKMIFSQ